MAEGQLGVIEKPKTEKLPSLPQEIAAIQTVWEKIGPSLKQLEESSADDISLSSISREDIVALFGLQAIQDITKNSSAKTRWEGDDKWLRIIRDIDLRYLHLEIMRSEDRQNEGVAMIRYFDARNDPYDNNGTVILEYNSNVEDIHKRISLSLLYPNRKGENSHQNYKMIVSSRSSQDVDVKYTIASAVDAAGKTIWKIEKPAKKNN